MATAEHSFLPSPTRRLTVLLLTRHTPRFPGSTGGGRRTNGKVYCTRSYRSVGVCLHRQAAPLLSSNRTVSVSVAYGPGSMTSWLGAVVHGTWYRTFGGGIQLLPLPPGRTRMAYYVQVLKRVFGLGSRTVTVVKTTCCGKQANGRSQSGNPPVPLLGNTDRRGMIGTYNGRIRRRRHAGALLRITCFLYQMPATVPMGTVRGRRMP